MTVKTVNNIVELDGLVPMLLVYDIYFRLTDVLPLSPSITTQAIAIYKVIIKIWKIRARQQISNALSMCNGLNILEILNLLL
jgi:hypothetical protein